MINLTNAIFMSQATKLRQQAYGEDHPITAKSLDFFAVIYGEVGRFQYSGNPRINLLVA